MYLPLMHRTAQYLAQYDDPSAWQTVGRMVDVSAAVGAMVREGQAGAAARAAGVRGVAVSPAGQQTTLGEGGSPTLALSEQGFYSVRMSGVGDRRPYEIAVNIDPAESDLASLPPAEFLKGATGGGTVTPGGVSLEQTVLTPSDIEKKQSIWWFLLVGGLVALLGEAILSNRLSRRAGFNLFATGGGGREVRT
jgi:hypothetical protein